MYDMIKRKILFACLTVLSFLMLGSVSVKADAATAKNMLPILRAMYHVDEAEAVLNDKVAVLRSCKKSKASDMETAVAQAAVADATNLLNTLNGLIARDTNIITLSPAGVVNPQSFATNSLAAQGAWNDFIYKEKTGHVLIFPAASVPKQSELTLACKPFSMYYR